MTRLSVLRIRTHFRSSMLSRKISAVKLFPSFAQSRAPKTHKSKEQQNIRRSARRIKQIARSIDRSIDRFLLLLFFHGQKLSRRIYAAYKSRCFHACSRNFGTIDTKRWRRTGMNRRTDRDLEPEISLEIGVICNPVSTSIRLRDTRSIQQIEENWYDFTCHLLLLLLISFYTYNKRISLVYFAFFIISFLIDIAYFSHYVKNLHYL